MDLTIYNGLHTSVREVRWRAPDDRIRRAWNNADDATRDGAYGVCLATIEVELGLVAVEQAETLTGADYYLAAEGANDLERAYRLEVSGTNHGTPNQISTRLREKVTQAKQGNSNLPAIAGVVGFLARIVAIQQVID